MTIVTMNTQEVLNVLERKGINGASRLSEDYVIIQNGEYCFSVAEKDLDRTITAIRQDHDEIKDLTHSEISEIARIL